MENDFERIMSSKTTKDLIQITRVSRDDYREEALEAAKKELERRNIPTQQVETIAQNIAEVVKRNVEVESNTVSSWVRLLNFLIDLLVCLLIVFILTYPLNVHINSHMLICCFILIVTYFLYYTIFEIRYQKTLGKMITKTKVVTLNEEVPSRTDIVIRSIMRLFFLDHFTFLFMRNGLHDSFSNTKVIKDNKKTTDR